MPDLEPGTRIGAFTVKSLLGQGGMGQVYRARDTKPGRDVAIKVLPEAFAADADRLARFEREAQVLASLNHPNIGGIYGLEAVPPSPEDSFGGRGSAPATQALILELVDGPTLADRIADGPLGVDEALPVARQIADALEAAHEAGVVHRDLKPANVKLRKDGTVKVLDFGLAKALVQGAPEGGPGATQSPTLTVPFATSPAAGQTMQGVVMGTAGYMAPEQAKGRDVDRRADVWAFGVVLYEMLTGTRAFAGDDVSDVLASVLAREPDLAALPNTVPDRIRRVIAACLEKNPKQRIHDIRLAMDGVFETAREGDDAVAERPPLSRRLRPLAATALVAAILGGGAMWLLKPEPPRPLVRFEHALGDLAFSRTGRQVLTVSPDGRRIAYVAGTRLYVRNLDDPAARPIAGVGDVTSPTLSRDGEWIAYWAPVGELRKIPGGGGTPVTLTEADNPFVGLGEAGLDGYAGTNYDVTADGQQFLVSVPVATGDGPGQEVIEIALNWLDELARLVPVP